MATFYDYTTSPIDVVDDDNQWVCTYRYEPFLKKWFYIEPNMHGEVMLIGRNDLPIELQNHIEIVEYDEQYCYYAPIKLQIQLNKSCNFSCKMCYVPEEEKYHSLSIENIDKVLEECKNIGVIRVNLVGGEIFMRKDIEQIVMLAKKHCLLVSCITNAIIPGSRIENFSNLLNQFYMVQVSCNGYGKSYDVEHNANVWERAKHCISNVIRETQSNILSYVVTEDNVNDIPSFVEFASKLKPNIIKFGSVCWSGKSKGMGTTYYYHEILPKARLLIEYCRGKYPFLKIQSQLDNARNSPLWEEYSNGYRPYEFYFSPEGRDDIYLNAIGEYYPFPLLSDRKEYRLGDLNQSLIDIWKNHPLLKNLRKVKFENSICGILNCDGVCGLWNRSYAIAWSDDIYGKVPCEKTNWK